MCFKLSIPNFGYILHGKTHRHKQSPDLFRTNQETAYIQEDYMCLTMKYKPTFGHEFAL